MYTMQRVLVVDDEPEIRMLVRRILEKAGYAVEEAESGEECMRLLSSRRFDVVLLEVLLPDSDGWEVCSSISGKAKVVVFTVCSSEEDVRRSLECGAAAHLGKPFTAARLLDLLARVCGGE
ncbi:MAG: response regulator [Euryarchaeota archaeon]|nr:response regulator [Euryarchaeota archaeon]